MFITTVCFFFLLKHFLWFFCCWFFRGGRALLGERVKGQISRVIPAMVTTKWDWRQSSQSKNRTSYKPYTSPIFGKTSQSKGYLRLRSRNLVFFSPCLFFFKFLSKRWQILSSHVFWRFSFKNGLKMDNNYLTIHKTSNNPRIPTGIKGEEWKVRK